MKEIQERMGDNGLTIELTLAARQWLAEAGYDSAFGARPLRRALQKFLESPLSMSLLSGEFHRDAHIIADVNEAKDGLIFSPAEQQVDIKVATGKCEIKPSKFGKGSGLNSRPF